MNNYSWLQQKLHQLALSSHFMREATFDLESSLVKPNQNNGEHVFVSGLARSGTTILLNAIDKSGAFSSLSYQDMPFVLAPNLWSKISFTSKNNQSIERAHRDNIKISSQSPEAFEEVFWMTFNEQDEDTHQKFLSYVQLINNKYNKNRYLSKNNQNIKRLELLSKLFPYSKILIPFRHPEQHAYSLLSQHNRFINYSKKDKFISDYMKWIGHSEFGPNYTPIHAKNLYFENSLDINHWIEQWFLVYSNILEAVNNKDNITFISYDRLCISEKYWAQILQYIGIKDTYSFSFKESRKEIPLRINKQLLNKALTLNSDLSKLFPG